MTVFLTILLLWSIPMITSIRMTCYSNTSLILPSNGVLYNNLTLQSCQCLIIQQNMSGFQYNSDENSCYIFGNNSSLSDIRVTVNSQVCFVNQTSTVYSAITTSVATLPSPPINISTSISNNANYAKETIILTNTAPLTSLSIVITVPNTLGVNGPSSYTTFWGDTTSNTINDTSTSVMYFFELINGQTIVSGQWDITAQFSFIGQARSTSNDTYVIQIDSYQSIYGHF